VNSYHNSFHCYGYQIKTLASRNRYQSIDVFIYFEVNLLTIIQYKWYDYTSTSQIKLRSLDSVMFSFTLMLLLPLLYLKRELRSENVTSPSTSPPPNPAAVVLSCILYETLEMNVLERKFISV
jgi:hypothetical protein